MLRHELYFSPLVLVVALLGCIGGPSGSTERISTLEDQTLSLQSENRALRETAENQANQLARLQQTLQTFAELGDRRMNELFYVSRIDIEKMSGGADFDGQPGDDGVIIFLELYDQDDQIFKAAGSIDVHIYDLSDPDHPELIAKYAYDVQAARKLWMGRLMSYHYKLKCPWQVRPPNGPQVVVRVMFLDYLTGSAFQLVRQFDVRLPPAPQPPPSDHPGSDKQ